MCKHIKAVFRMRDGVVMTRAALRSGSLEKSGDWALQLEMFEDISRLENYFEMLGNRLEMEAEKLGMKPGKCVECALENRVEKFMRADHHYEWLRSIQDEAETWGKNAKA